MTEISTCRLSGNRLFPFSLNLLCPSPWRNEGNLRYNAQLTAVRAKVPNLVVRRVHSDTFLLEANMRRLAKIFRKSKWLAFHMRWGHIACSTSTISFLGSGQDLFLRCYRVTMVVRDNILLTSILKFHNLAQLLCHFCLLCICTSRFGHTVEQPNWSQHNMSLWPPCVSMYD